MQRVIGMAAFDRGKQLNLIDWRPSIQRYIIRLIEEGDNIETDCRIDN